MTHRLKKAAWLAFAWGLSFASSEARALDFESNALHPGKSDAWYRHARNSEEFNYIWWSPVFKGGAGLIDPENAAGSSYAGGFVRPLAVRPAWGDLIVGAQSVDTPGSDASEVQGEYRFPFGLGFGGGAVERTRGVQDASFWKVTFRRPAGRWSYVLEAQEQKVGDERSPGGYAALYDGRFMAIYGNDGEQWRACAGFVAADRPAFFRPALEALYVDNTIGDLNGTQFLFVNATLRFEGGFLSHPARLGRGMGPTGLEFGNPLGFLTPTFNRQLNVWEMGQRADVRFSRQRFPDGTVQESWEGLVFPLQFLGAGSGVAEGFFLGGFYAKAPAPPRDSSGVLGGISGKMGPFLVSLETDYNADTHEKRAVVGLIDPF